MYLNEYDLNLPQVPSEEEWQEGIAKLKGLHREAIIVQAKGCNLIKNISETKATSERVGWLHLWAKTFSALDSAISAFNSGSGLILKMISRSTFEWILHLRVIMESTVDKPDNNLKNNGLKNGRASQIIDRLRAYTAWCFWSDKAYYEECVDWRTLAGLWDESTALNIMKDEQQLKMHEENFGPLNVELDEKKLRKRRLEMKRNIENRLNEINHWLEDPYLNPWVIKLEELKKYKGHISFFSLFDPNADSVPKVLRKKELRFGYSRYLKGSMILHGSTMEHFISIGTSALGPNIKADDVELKNEFEDIISDCEYLFFSLAAIEHYYLSKKQLR